MNLTKIDAVIADYHNHEISIAPDQIKVAKDRYFTITKLLSNHLDRVEQAFNNIHDKCLLNKAGIFHKDALHDESDYVALTPRPSGNVFFVHRQVSDIFTNNNLDPRDIQSVARLWLHLYPESKLGKLLFVSDKLKYAQSIGYNYQIYYTASDFTVSDNSYGYLRFNGGNKGQGKYSSNLRKEYKDIHVPNLRMAFNGNTSSEIACAMTGEVLENQILSNRDGDDFVRQVGVAWHHIKYTKKKSDSKEGEPSKKFLKKTVSDKEWLEIFTCIPLREDRHNLVHLKLDGDAMDWVHWLRDGTAKFIPYVWRSESKFNKVCKVLGITTLTYEDLVNRLFYIDETASYSEAVKYLKS